MQTPEKYGRDDTRSSSGGGGVMSLMQYFFHEADLKDALYSNGACALTSDITDQRYFTAKVPQSAGDAYVTVQTYQLLDSGYCEALNGRTIEQYGGRRAPGPGVLLASLAASVAPPAAARPRSRPMH